jgi:hypothetical protein
MMIIGCVVLLQLIEKFKEKIKDYIKPHHTDDTFIRFLRARAYDLDKATEMFVASMVSFNTH